MNQDVAYARNTESGCNFVPDWSREKQVFIGFISAVMSRDSYMRSDCLAMTLIVLEVFVTANPCSKINFALWNFVYL